jgi:hypothetical protein
MDGAANWLLAGGSPGPGVVAFQVPITFNLCVDGTSRPVAYEKVLKKHHRLAACG